MNERSESGIRPAGSRAPVNLCPYCGEDDLRPDEADPADETAWLCRACLRRFCVTYRGMVAR